MKVVKRDFRQGAIWGIVFIGLLLESSFRTEVAFLPIAIALTGWWSLQNFHGSLGWILFLSAYEYSGTGNLYFLLCYPCLALFLRYLRRWLDMEELGILGITILEISFYLLTYTIWISHRVSLIDWVIGGFSIWVINQSLLYFSKSE